MKKKYISIIILFLITPLMSQNGWTFNNSGKNEIVINTYVNVNLGEVVKGITKNTFYEEQLIKFEIKCTKNKRIRILKTKEPGNDYIKFETEWKAGQYTGFEEIYNGDGIYLPENEYFYVTMKIKSVLVLSQAPSGSFSFIPEISVEYVDL